MADIVTKRTSSGTLRDVFTDSKGPIPDWHAAAGQQEKNAYLRDTIVRMPISAAGTASPLTGATGIMNYPKADPQVRFSVEIVENGYVVNSGTKTYICEGISKVGERVVALLAAKQMDKL